MEYLYLTTTGRHSGQPREIEIWFTRRDGRDYVIAEEGERAHWVRNLLADPRVEWRVGEARFTGRAHVVDGALATAVQALSTEKYGWSDGLVVELTPDRRRRLTTDLLRPRPEHRPTSAAAVRDEVLMVAKRLKGGR